ncbi:hypothetical protein PHYSODRAFT_247052 [Phytophthora sojae]|uniref:Apple domain-containing protein n=1 Tax=Phytophthora sojae (strain P6497) TaxID=1094619 RepID=G4Z8P8_PHYSP|nr:hypothetical protein PHYSODRAFT_247052 [Phytophthora sojae]EGZ19080.1 hypothetical protein PHYSODRAFT_247052 [Phytophthora sojae]|eukprot:XP_009521797.1 hypothetical protein PHYSODRAFT_247052 [Phytophthora sojae]
MPANQCLVEYGFNYLANDLGNMTSSSPDDCCAECVSTDGCRAYSWTGNAEGNADGSGTCWFKTGRGTVVADEYVHSSEDCCDICSGFPGCRAYTFSPYAGGTCWLKSEKGLTVVNPETTSAQVFLEAPSCGIEYGVEYLGNDIGFHLAEQPDDCCDLCSDWEGCQAWSWVWVEGQGGTCYFKNRANEWIHSGQVRANPVSPSCVLELDVDYIGNDIGDEWSGDPYACCSMCMTIEGCNAFSWTDYNGSTCCFKSAKGEAVGSVGIHSAIV